jgi:NhaP-type Na+/H+ or K+/H+ antiporter
MTVRRYGDWSRGIRRLVRSRSQTSVISALLAAEDLRQPAAEPTVTVITITVPLSVITHGITANPLARRCGARQETTASASGQANRADEVPERRRARRTASAAPPGRS